VARLELWWLSSVLWASSFWFNFDSNGQGLGTACLEHWWTPLMLQVSSCWQLSQPECIWYTSLKEKVGSCATGVKFCHNKQLEVINELWQMCNDRPLTNHPCAAINCCVSLVARCTYVCRVVWRTSFPEDLRQTSHGLLIMITFFSQFCWGSILN